MTPPNILLITTDQQRFDTIHSASEGYPGNPYIRTPHLNWLCDNGIHFTRCYTDAPICVAARTTIMTGRHGYTNGLTSNAGDSLPIDPARSLPGLLTHAGYQTRAVGKMHFLPNRAHYGFEHMEILEDYYREMAQHPERGRPTDHGLGQNEMEPGIATVSETHSLTYWTVDRSINFLETRDPTRPFFLWTSFSKPHPPFDPVLHYWLMYQNAAVPEPVVGDWSERVEDIPPGFLESAYVLNNLDRFSPALILDIRRAYYALITQIDYNLGLLFARMRELELLNNTLILFTSDHGEMLGDHHIGAKTIFLEGSAHVPLIVCPPGFPDETRGTACGSFATLADILPTCAAVAGVPLPEEKPIDGLDLVELAEGATCRETFIGECGDQFAVIEGAYKYVTCLPGAPELLFNLAKDPYEKHDLIAAKGHTDIAATFRERLLQHLRDHHPELISNGSILATKPSPVKGLRGRWPGFHSRQQPDEVLH
jgi:arylsulfatase A-like enzyme